MLIERYASDTALSPSEYRVRVAARWQADPNPGGTLPEALRANLTDAYRLHTSRMLSRRYGVYDGRLRDPAVLNQLVQQFGPDRILSPTALEDYVACPFRFFLGDVLRLQPLEDPREEIEVARRGQAVHRALARLHLRLKGEEIHLPNLAVAERVAQEIQDAVAEDVRRAPSPAAKQLWQLEGQRLLRQVGRYGQQWHKFLEPWHKRGLPPRPHLFEIDFGLPPRTGSNGEPLACHGPLILRTSEGEVRISGRIDRVDCVPLADGGVAFWVIDYKTGRAKSYSGSLVTSFRRLQLTLYAMAVEDVLLAGQNARPLGLAYWLVTDGGPKVVLPQRGGDAWLTDTARWRQLRATLAEWVVTLIRHIRGGVFPLQPRDDNCTSHCDYGRVCRIAQARAVTKEGSLPLPTVPGREAE
jgi:RecB family exonuclease